MLIAGEDDEKVYDKKPQRYVKDNSTAYIYLTARSDKSVAYVTSLLDVLYC